MIPLRRSTILEVGLVFALFLSPCLSGYHSELRLLYEPIERFDPRCLQADVCTHIVPVDFNTRRLPQNLLSILRKCAAKDTAKAFCHSRPRYALGEKCLTRYYCKSVSPRRRFARYGRSSFPRFSGDAAEDRTRTYHGESVVALPIRPQHHIRNGEKRRRLKDAFAFVGVEPTKKFFQEIFITEVTAVYTSVFACSIYHLDCICQEKFVALFVAHTAEFYKTTRNFTEFAEICKSAKKYEKA